MKELEEHYGDKLRVEYRHYPLSFQKFAETSAIASMAAAKQGKFWEMVEKLYADTKNQDQATLVRYAGEIGLDVAQFQADQKNPDIVRYVRMEAKAGEKVGVKGTPSMFLNGRKLEARDVEAFKREIDAELAAIEQLTSTGKSVTDARRERVLAGGGVAFLDFVVDRVPIEVDTAPPVAAAAPPPTPVDKTVFNAEIFPGDPMKGPADALVTIVECTDFQ